MGCFGYVQKPASTVLALTIHIRSQKTTVNSTLGEVYKFFFFFFFFFFFLRKFKDLSLKFSDTNKYTFILWEKNLYGKILK